MLPDARPCRAGTVAQRCLRPSAIATPCTAVCSDHLHRSMHADCAQMISCAFLLNCDELDMCLTTQFLGRWQLHQTPFAHAFEKLGIFLLEFTASLVRSSHASPHTGACPLSSFLSTRVNVVQTRSINFCDTCKQARVSVYRRQCQICVAAVADWACSSVLMDSLANSFKFLRNPWGAGKPAVSQPAAQRQARKQGAEVVRVPVGAIPLPEAFS